MRRRLFNIAALASLLLCLVSGALWARSLGHFEKLCLRHTHWPAPNEVHSHYLQVIWYHGGRLRVGLNCRKLTAAYFDGRPSALKQARLGYTPGLKCNFFDTSNATMGPEFPFSETVHWRSSSVKHGHHWQLSIRLWLPTLLSGVLPAIWVYRWRRFKEHPWQFSMRELFVAFTFLSILLGLGIRLAY